MFAGTLGFLVDLVDQQIQTSSWSLLKKLLSIAAKVRENITPTSGCEFQYPGYTMVLYFKYSDY